MISDSSFNLWRACVAFCYIDGRLDANEKKWMEEKIHFIKFSDEQKAQLKNELETPPSLKEVLPHITDPVDRGNLVNYLRQLAHLDNNLCEAEKTLINDLTQNIFEQLNIDELELKLTTIAKSSSRENRKGRVDDLAKYADLRISGDFTKFR